MDELLVISKVLESLWSSDIAFVDNIKQRDAVCKVLEAMEIDYRYTKAESGEAWRFEI